ncbi:hypothetical protein F4559_004495 [Saccharothrix violaceirubra]|uniref:Uncharacterized protein n=1 Tax=Saccharothrix violaceirubra TaxID=413306 RepID=A0A7W7T6B8_9PSEU|nr:hypothetical protein [Saccharothrix violaceirubra]
MPGAPRIANSPHFDPAHTAIFRRRATITPEKAAGAIPAPPSEPLVPTTEIPGTSIPGNAPHLTSRHPITHRTPRSRPTPRSGTPAPPHEPGRSRGPLDPARPRTSAILGAHTGATTPLRTKPAAGERLPALTPTSGCRPCPTRATIPTSTSAPHRPEAHHPIPSGPTTSGRAADSASRGFVDVGFVGRLVTADFGACGAVSGLVLVGRPLCHSRVTFVRGAIRSVPVRDFPLSSDRMRTLSPARPDFGSRSDLGPHPGLPSAPAAAFPPDGSPAGTARVFRPTWNVAGRSSFAPVVKFVARVGGPARRSSHRDGTPPTLATGRPDVGGPRAGDHRSRRLRHPRRSFRRPHRGVPCAHRSREN